MEEFSGIVLPRYLRHAFKTVSGEASEIPDYITPSLIERRLDGIGWLPESALSTFEQIWNFNLSLKRDGNRISVLEPACGSANDYRYLQSFGISKFLEYTGFDLCNKNIANARRKFPDMPFKAWNILDILADSKSYDYLFVHDIFEHLSPCALERALAEVSRVTRKQACLNFFNMTDNTEHIFKCVNLYHWNTLSLSRIKELLMNSASDIEVVHIDMFLQNNYGCDDFHNKNAYTLIVSFN